jgi:hypothetical protein
MRQMRISNVKEGMILGETLRGKNGGILLSAGNILKANFISRIEQEGYNFITIDDHTDTLISFPECLSQEQKKEAIDAIKNLNIDTGSQIIGGNLDKVALSIVETIAHNNDIAFDLLDIRNDSDYCYFHSLATAELSIAIAQEYRNQENNRIYNIDYLGNIATAALLMNIGESCKNDKVRKNLDIKNEKIINIENYNKFDVPEYGHSLTHKAYSINNYAVISSAILYSKTNENGTNCPTGREESYNNYKKNKDRVIPKILHVADWYTNLVIQKKENGKARNPAEAMEIILGASGKAFDMKVVDVFLHYVAIYPIGIDVLLSNGEHAMVVGNNLGADGYNYRPIVQTEDGNVYNLMDKECRNLTIIPDDTRIEEDEKKVDDTFKYGIVR